jgi:hypothetical protein
MPARRPLLHFSEDPSIARFTPHVPRTNPDQAPAVWAIDIEHAPLYWFPRDCPRGAVWADSDEQRVILRRTFQTGANRVQATELAWLDRIRAARLFVYELDPAPFEPWPDADGQWIARAPVEPIAVRPVGDLLELHARAGIELRFVPDLWVFWRVVLQSGLPFSGVRLRNAWASPDEPEDSSRPG